MNEEHLPGRTLQAGAAAQEGSETGVLSRQSKPGVGFKTCSKSNDGLVPMGMGHSPDLCRPCPVQWSHLLFPSSLYPGSSHLSLKGVFQWKLLISSATSPPTHLAPSLHLDLLSWMSPHSWKSCHHAQ